MHSRTSTRRRRCVENFESLCLPKTSPLTFPYLQVDSEDDSDDSEEEEDDDDDDEADSDESGSSSEDDSAEEEAPPKKRKAEADATASTKKAKTTTTDVDDTGSKNLFVGNLSWNVDEDWLTREFEEFGELTGTRVISDKQTGRSKGYVVVRALTQGRIAKMMLSALVMSSSPTPPTRPRRSKPGRVPRSMTVRSTLTSRRHAITMPDLATTRTALKTEPSPSVTRPVPRATPSSSVTSHSRRTKTSSARNSANTEPSSVSACRQTWRVATPKASATYNSRRSTRPARLSTT